MVTRLYGTLTVHGRSVSAPTEVTNEVIELKPDAIIQTESGIFVVKMRRNDERGMENTVD